MTPSVHLVSSLELVSFVCTERVASGMLTVELLQNPVDGPRAAAAAHANVELVGMSVGHGVCAFDACGLRLYRRGRYVLQGTSSY